MRDFLRSLIIILLFLCLLTAITGCVFLSTEPYDYYSGSDFELRIAMSEPLTNATFCIPLPVEHGIPKVGDHVLGESDLGNTGYSYSLTDSPPGLDLEGAYLFPGNRPSFICVSAKTMKGDIEYWKPNTSYLVDVDTIESHDNPRLFFNTLYPIGNESVLLPKLYLVLPSPVPVENRRKYLDYLMVYKDMHVRQSVPIYAEYNATPSAVVSANLNLYVYNGWRQGSTSHGNSYTDFIYWGTRGESHGWQRASGEIFLGSGAYPDYSHPAWRDTIRKFQLEKTG